MENTEGGYFSAIDADNDQGEGGYYMFNIQELKKVADQDLSMILDYYRIDLKNTVEDYLYHLRKIWENKFSILKEKKEFPLIDKKIIASWNAQMILGLMNSFEALI